MPRVMSWLERREWKCKALLVLQDKPAGKSYVVIITYNVYGYQNLNNSQVLLQGSSVTRLTINQNEGFNCDICSGQNTDRAVLIVLVGLMDG